jgi:hypothetical protein
VAPDTITPRSRTTRPNRDRRPVDPRPPETAETMPEGIGAVGFAESLLHLSRPSLENHVAELHARRISPDDDVAWWEATIALNRVLRRKGTGHQATMAAHLASQAVLAAATRTGLALSPDVTAVARSAGEVARMLVAGESHTTAAGYLAHGWEDILIPPAAPPSPSGAAGGRGNVRPRAAAHQPMKGRRT